MSENKRYYWLKLHEDFFKSKRIKKLRKLGADYVIIYLKLQLLALNNKGIIEYSGIEDSFAKELELEIDEDADKIQLTLSYLQSCELLVPQDGSNDEFFLPYVEICTASETASTRRSQKSRALKALQCNTDMLQRNGDIEIDIDIEKDIDIDKKKNNKKKSVAFQPPTVEMVKEYCTEKNYSINPEIFVDYYESKGWLVGKAKMKDWKAAVRTWVAKDRESKPSGNVNLNF